MGWWQEHVVPRLVDKGRSPAVSNLRVRVCADLSGDVIEIGFGSGLNVAHYPSAVRSVSAVEPSEVAWKMARPRIAASGMSIQREGLDAQHLTTPDGRYDTALSTLTMCTIPDLDTALAEIRRVLRPGGTLHFIEHGRSPEARIARWQDRLQPLNGRLAGGCHINRPIGDHLMRSGLEIEELETFYIQKPTPFTYAFLGRARNTT
jgi:ubiquinone/menaquinone biosynthesis C-methylase UbiE